MNKPSSIPVYYRDADGEWRRLVSDGEWLRGDAERCKIDHDKLDRAEWQLTEVKAPSPWTRLLYCLQAFPRLKTMAYRWRHLRTAGCVLHYFMGNDGKAFAIDGSYDYDYSPKGESPADDYIDWRVKR